jgi:carboxyl-terminal processing protease
MSELDTSEGRRINWLLIFVAGIAGISLSICTATIGFATGRASVAPEKVTETITEFQEIEVTREVPVTVLAETQVVATPAGEQEPIATVVPQRPTSVPTSEPSPTPRAFGSAAADATDFTVFNEVWSLVDIYFDGELPAEDEILHGAISGSLEMLGDTHTRYIPPDLAELSREEDTGSISGIGAYVRENEDGLAEIVAPIEGQPAELAGLLPGDVIIAVDDQSVTNIDYFQVVLMVRGPEGTVVKLSVQRDGLEDPIEFTIVRTTFDVPVVETEIFGEPGSAVAYLQLTEFTRDATAEVLTALTELLVQNPQGLIFDLRNNPGGFLSQSIEIADIFLGESDIAYRRNNRGLEEAFVADSGDIGETIPLVILVNSGSASASEIVAGAVQAHGRGLLVGETTLGKGSVQSVISLSDGSELRVTSAKWFTPNNQSIHERGVEPDVQVPMPLEVQLGSDDDEQLRRAIEILTGGT